MRRRFESYQGRHIFRLDGAWSMVAVVLTGFEPFDGADINPSWAAVQLAASLLSADGIDVVCEELPVEFGAAPARVAELLSLYEPQVLIATGLAGRATGMRLEQLAVNEIDARIPDNAGVQPRGAVVAAEAAAPVSYTTTLPLAITDAWSSAGIAWEPSDNAGRYVCNATFYALQHAAVSRPAGATDSLATGFIHVPPVSVIPVVTSAEALRLAVLAALG